MVWSVAGDGGDDEDADEDAGEDADDDDDDDGDEIFTVLTHLLATPSISEFVYKWMCLYI